MGASYASGQGVVKDEAKAVQSFQKAAEGGSVSARISLGKLYNGQSFTKEGIKVSARGYSGSSATNSAFFTSMKSSAESNAADTEESNVFCILM